MPVEQRSTYDGDGAYVRIVEFVDEDTEYDRIVVRIPPDSDVMAVEGYDGDELVYEQAFQNRALQFDPISAIGRGETEKLTGTSTDTDESVPSDVESALNGLGMAVVPDGEWWL